MSTIPTKEGYYWAKWRLNDGSIDRIYDYSSPTGTWTIVMVYQDDENEWRAYLNGIPGSQPIENFFWGPGPLVEPPSTQVDLTSAKERERAAILRYQRMTPEEREAFLEKARRNL